jgi:HTH-type transcriptional regulator, sugar sensing transcriptional regulator
MTTDDEFTHRLIGFGLSEKEAQLYLHLLKYGPKTPSPLAKSLKTYREDVHRTLTSLIEKGMVRPSLDSPTIYAAVDLDTALESALTKQESELREMEARKRELQELAKQQQFRPSDEVATFKIIKSLKELLTTMLPILTSLEEEWLCVIPTQAAVVFSQFGMLPFTQEFIERGGKQLVIIDLTYPIIGTIRELLDIGGDIRHFGKQGFLYTVFDRKISITAINAELTRFSLDEPIAALYVEDRTYARYLTSSFEMLWKQSIPAEERIQELLKEGPPQA